MTRGGDLFSSDVPTWLLALAIVVMLIWQERQRWKRDDHLR